MNQGEQNEILLKAYLMKCFYSGEEWKRGPKELRKINSISFGPGIAVNSWKPLYDHLLFNKDWETLGKIFGKAKSGFKADVEINGIRYSIKYSKAGRSALLNHTHRGGIIKVCDRIGLDIKELDKIINEYWRLRESGVITEDIKNNCKKSPFCKKKKSLKKLIEYFLFKGTAQGDSIFPADKLISFNDPYDPSTYKIFEPEEAVDLMWDTLIFSVRSKAMPQNYNKKANIELAPWTRFSSNAYRGSLHIRF